MKSFLKIVKVEHPAGNTFRTVEIDSTTGKELTTISEYDKLGMIYDVEANVMLKVGKYDKVEKKFRQIEQRYKDAMIGEYLDDIRLYDISNMQSDVVSKLTTHSSIIQKHQLEPFTFIQAKGFDDCEIVE